MGAYRADSGGHLDMTPRGSQLYLPCQTSDFSHGSTGNVAYEHFGGGLNRPRARTVSLEGGVPQISVLPARFLPVGASDC